MDVFILEREGTASATVAGEAAALGLSVHRLHLGSDLVAALPSDPCVVVLPCEGDRHLDGLHLLQEIQQSATDARTVVIANPYATSDDCKFARSCGAEEFLSAPLDPIEVRRVLHSLTFTKTKGDSLVHLPERTSNRPQVDTQQARREPYEPQRDTADFEFDEAQDWDPAHPSQRSHPALRPRERFMAGATPGLLLVLALVSLATAAVALAAWWLG